MQETDSLTAAIHNQQRESTSRVYGMVKFVKLEVVKVR